MNEPAMDDIVSFYYEQQEISFDLFSMYAFDECVADERVRLAKLLYSYHYDLFAISIVLKAVMAK